MLAVPAKLPDIKQTLSGASPPSAEFPLHPVFDERAGKEPIRNDTAGPETTMDETAKAIGIDIGGTKIAVAAVDARGAIAGRSTIATEAELGFERGVVRIVDAADQALAAAGWSRKDLCGVGVGCAGPVSPTRGIINNPYTLPTWIDCNIVAALEQTFGCPAYLENDADAAALGECFAGAGRGYRNVVMLTLGTGVGGGVVIESQIYRGAQGEHPELGHMAIDSGGPECYCGASGCLESIVSGTAITAAGRLDGYQDSRQVFAAASCGESAALAIVAPAQGALASAVWTLLHTFMPELIVLGGGIGDNHYPIFAAAIDGLLPRATMVPPGGTRFVKALLANEAGIVGAASVAMSRVGQRTKP